MSGWVYAGNSTKMVSEDGVHFRPAVTRGGPRCGQVMRYQGRTCGRKAGHPGPHRSTERYQAQLVKEARRKQLAILRRSAWA